MIIICSASTSESQTEEKKYAARQLIKQYYYQLTQGCGNEKCTNEHCASSQKAQMLDPNLAAAQVYSFL